jgi:ATP-binding cassette subfamily C protein
MLSSVLKIYRLLSSRQKRGFLLVGFATLLLNAVDILAIVIVGLIVSVSAGDGELPLAFPWRSADLETIVISLLLVCAGLFSFKTLAGVLLARIRANFLARLESAFSDKIAAHVFGADLDRVKSYSRSELEWAILRSTNTAFGNILGSALQLFAESTLALSVLALFIYVDPISALAVTLYFAGVLGVFELATSKRVSKTGQDFTDGSVSVGQAISDTLEAFKEISVVSRLDYFLNKISFFRRKVSLGTATLKYMGAIPRLIVELALIVGALSFLVLQLSISEGNLNFAVIGIFIVGSLRMMSSLLPLQRAFMTLRHELPQASGAYEIIELALRTEPQFSPAVTLTERVWPAGEDDRLGLKLELTNVSFSYSDSTSKSQAIQGINLTVQAGTTVALIGRSGAGKSTLVDLILGLHEPTTGVIRCSGLPPKEARSRIPGIISYMPQKPGIVAGSIMENIALGIPMEDISESQVWSAVVAAELGPFVESLPNGIYSPLGMQGDALSGGQIQRIGLARAFYSRPRLLVLDEATSALDAETESAVEKSLRALGKRTTTVIVAHRLSTVQNADVVFLLDSGQVVASGTLRDLMQNNKTVQKFISLMEIRR